VVVYRGLELESPERVKEHLASHSWTSAWINGIFDFPHYHSTAHEVLVCTGGNATLQLGGDGGRELEIRSGDAMVLPAGTAHQRLSSDGDFTIVGAYPEGQSFDMMYGKAEERPEADRRIRDVDKPVSDPFYDSERGLWELWKL